MIHATSLRLGNLILEAGEIKKVYQLSIGGKTYDSINNMRVNRETGLIDNGEDIFQHIPLTAEWLERCGFKDGGSHDGGESSWRHPKFPFGLSGNGPGAGFDVYYYDDNDCIYSADVESINQLQNLFHALTGEELAIKTTTV